ncbi:hypothetical protein BGP_6557 [Beggiatoa sp. PS]|nr:hypothetical protein BGP_6557 [Beggiatoa sp. PS]
MAGKYLKGVSDFILWYAKDSERVKYRQLLSIKKAGAGDNPGKRYDQLELADGTRRALSTDEKTDVSSIPPGSKIYQLTDLTSISNDDKTSDEYEFLRLMSIFRLQTDIGQQNLRGGRNLKIC